MKKTKTKILSIILSIAIVLSAVTGLSLTASAATKTGTTGDLSWSLDTSTGVFTLSGTGYGANYANSYSKRAPWYTFYRSQIKSVVVESGVVGIGDYSFYNCTNLTSVTIASTVDTIGTCCFRSCTSLENITLPSGCSWYYKELFLDCTSLKWAVMPTTNSTDSYGGKLPDGTFSGCTSLEEVYIGSGHTALDTKAFYNCKSLKGVVWASGTINSVGTSALDSVPSSCVFVDDTSMASWASSNGVSYLSATNTCSDDTYSSSKLTATLNTDTMKLSFSGSGNMSSTPWSVFHYLIKDISFENVDNTYSISTRAFENCVSLNTIVFNSSSNGELHIYPYAFNGCGKTTYWINLPANVRYIDDHAFYGTGFNYITIASDSVSVGDSAFGNGTGSYARFFGVRNSGVYDFVKAGQAKGYDWHYYCYNDEHLFNSTTVSPTCTEQGYDIFSCPYCDAENEKTHYTEPLGHKYSYTSTNGSTLIYNCERCSATGLELDAYGVLNLFTDAISHDNDNAPYNQSNYASAVDVYQDGYINAKDFLIINSAANNVDLTNKQTVLNESTTYQTIEGFGASACWWSQSVGNWENIDEVMELLYGTDKGIGLNIYRYNLGAGSQDDTVMYDTDRRTECFLQSDGTYDWTADAGAMNALATAQKINSDLKVTLFCNSAPISMTDNGHAFCSPSSSSSYNSNMSSSNYQAFADYVVKCAEHFIDEGYNVTSVSPINEPEWSWAAWYNTDGSMSMNQEGCHWEVGEARTFYNDYMVPAMQNSNKLNGKVDLSVWESGQINHSSYWDDFMNYMFSSSTSIFSNYGDKNSNIRSYCDSLDTHSYWSSQSDKEAVASQLTESKYSAVKKVRCTEYCQMTGDTNSGVYDLIQQEGGNTNGMTMPYGLALANIIYQDLTILNAVEWDWWVACAKGIYPDGLIYINENDHSDLQIAKRLWVLGNYSKFIDEGAKRISVSTQSAITSDIKESAYLNPDGSVAIVYINSGDTTQFTTFDSSKYSTFTTYVTDEMHDLDRYQSGTVGKKAVAIPANSVTTVVLGK